MANILLVEDDDAFRYAAGRYLSSKGHTVIDVSSSMEALKVLDTHGKIDIIVADIALYPQEPHGFALARMIRFKNPEIRVLFVTGNLEILKAEPGMEGEAILYKPVELKALLDKISDLLRRPAG